VDFEPAILAQLRGEIVRVTRLAEFQFRSGTQRFHPGYGLYQDTDGRKWHPTMGIGSVSGISQSHNGSAPEIRFQLSGVDPDFIEKARGSVTDYYDRLCFVYWQFWDAQWAPIGKPKAFMWGLMKSLISSRTMGDKGTMSLLTLTAETPFEGRSRARNGYLTDRDQKTRHPGDQMLEQVAGIEAKEIRFPDY
jgi:hypothetical protein